MKVEKTNKYYVKETIKLLANLLWIIMLEINAFKGELCLTIMFGVFLIDSSMILFKEEIIEILKEEYK